MHRWFGNTEGHFYLISIKYDYYPGIRMSTGMPSRRTLINVKHWTAELNLGCFWVFGLHITAVPEAFVCNPLDATRFDPCWKCCNGHLLWWTVWSYHVLLFPISSCRTMLIYETTSSLWAWSWRQWIWGSRFIFVLHQWPRWAPRKDR